MEITKEEINLVLAFLNRCTLQPSEINAYIRINQRLQSGLKEPEKDKEAT